MKISVKNVVNSTVFLLGMLLCYHIYSQQSSNSPLIELSSQNNSMPNCIDADFEIHEDDQIIYALTFSPSFQKNEPHNHPHIIRRSAQPFFTVWQPPKAV